MIKNISFILLLSSTDVLAEPELPYDIVGAVKVAQDAVTSYKKGITKNENHIVNNITLGRPTYSGISLSCECPLNLDRKEDVNIIRISNKVEISAKEAGNAGIDISD